MAIKLIIDSSCDMIQKEFADNFVKVMPIMTFFGSDEFVDGVNITKEEFFEKLKTNKDFPKTSQVNSQSFKEVFSKIREDGDEVLGIFISSKLSGTYSSATTAATETGSGGIRIIDSMHATIGYAALIDEAIKLIKEGLALDEIADRLEELRQKIRFYAVVNDLTYLKKGGRLNSGLVFLIASTLKIKPIFTLTEGEIATAGKTLGFKKACTQICQYINQSDLDLSRPLYIAHGDSEEMQQTLLEHIQSSTKVTRLVFRRVGLSVGAHTGPECTGVAYFVK